MFNKYASQGSMYQDQNYNRYNEKREPIQNFSFNQKYNNNYNNRNDNYGNPILSKNSFENKNNFQMSGSGQNFQAPNNFINNSFKAPDNNNNNFQESGNEYNSSFKAPENNNNFNVPGNANNNSFKAPDNNFNAPNSNTNDSSNNNNYSDSSSKQKSEPPKSGIDYDEKNKLDAKITETKAATIFEYFPDEYVMKIIMNLGGINAEKKKITAELKKSEHQKHKWTKDEVEAKINAIKSLKGDALISKFQHKQLRLIICKFSKTESNATIADAVQNTAPDSSIGTTVMF